MSHDPAPNPASASEEDKTSLTLTLPDGRQLGYALYGSSTGQPIILHHGMACSRLDGASFDEVAEQLSIRIIGIDRPGMGLSTFHPKRELLDFAKDVGHLTDHLKLDGYCVMGISGGGPSTLACAYALPSSKLKAVAMVVALGPPDIGMKGARLINRIGYSSYGLPICPSFLNRWFWRREPIGRVDLSDEQRLDMAMQQVEASKSTMPEQEKEIMNDIEFHKTYLKSTREGFAQGYDGVLLDGKLCCLDFGFKVEDIRADLPVHLWYAKQDVLVPANHGVQLAKRLGSRAVLRLKDETHVSLTVRYKREILESLLKVM